MSKRIPEHEVVLVGLNHCHLEVIRQYSNKTSKPYRLSLVYSQNKYNFKENLASAIKMGVERNNSLIDVGHLCYESGVTLYHDKVTYIDHNEKNLRLSKYGRTVSFDALSIETISDSLFIEDNLAKYTGQILDVGHPQDFLAEWQKIENKVAGKNSNDEIYRLAVIGTSNCGLEISISALERLKKISHNSAKIEVYFFSKNFILKKKTLKTVLKSLDKIGVKYIDCDISKISTSERNISVENFSESFDSIICAGAGKKPKWLVDSNLIESSENEPKVKKTFEVVSAPSFYYVPEDKADDYTYHMIPYFRRSRRKAFTLTHNILTHFVGVKPKLYKKRPFKAAIVNLGSLGSLFSFYGISFTFNFVTEIKNRIDKRWIGRYRSEPKNIRLSTFVESGIAPQTSCFGGSSSLPKGVSNRSETAASLDLGNNQILFEAFDDLTSAGIDLFAFGRVGVNNVINKLVASKSYASSLQYSITVPYGPKKNMVNDFKQVELGIKHQCVKEKIEIIGSKAKCGSESMLSIVGLSSPFDKTTGNFQKANYNQLDLILTKPLGTGVAIESFKHNILSTQHLYEMIDHMVTSISKDTAESIIPLLLDIKEVTGYGLIDCLEELMETTNCGVEISLKSLPIYSGVLNSISKDIRANLHAQNKYKYTGMFMNLDTELHFMAEMLFDPQTSGPLLLVSVPENTDKIINLLKSSNLVYACRIGKTNTENSKLIFKH